MELTHTDVKCLPAKFQREAEDLFMGCRTPRLVGRGGLKLPITVDNARLSAFQLEWLIKRHSNCRNLAEAVDKYYGVRLELPLVAAERGFSIRHEALQWDQSGLRDTQGASWTGVLLR
jgi:hypothetical protein